MALQNAWIKSECHAPTRRYTERLGLRQERVPGYQALSPSPREIREIQLLWLAHDGSTFWAVASRPVDPVDARSGVGLLGDSERTKCLQPSVSPIFVPDRLAHPAREVHMVGVPLPTNLGSLVCCRDPPIPEHPRKLFCLHRPRSRRSYVSDRKEESRPFSRIGIDEYEHKKRNGFVCFVRSA